ncbi:MAG: SUMF1/EgtB/PvdO family nonheme iron enzyme [Polyangiaceae bacterium]
MTLRSAATLLLLPLLFGCGQPSVRSGSADGGEAPGTYVVDDAGVVVKGDGTGANVSGGEAPGIAPSCVIDGGISAGEMVDIPAGPFVMGCNEIVDPECRSDEQPKREVTLDAYAIDKTEVTEAQYYACVAAGKCTYPKCPWDPCARGAFPVSCITRPQAVAYCAFAGTRLPTEAEWEKAARGTDGRRFPWGNGPASCFLANLLGCNNGLEPVGTRPQNASPFGVLDLAGNVVEWTQDFYDPNYFAYGPTTNPRGPDRGDHYVGRGGGFLSEAIWDRASSRDNYPPAYSRVSLGVRCAK